MLEPGDLLVFYCGLEGWGVDAEPSLYIIGYFEIAAAGRASEFTAEERRALFSQNFHVRHKTVYDQQENSLVLVKGSSNSRLLTKAFPISTIGKDSAGKRLKVLSPEMQLVFGEFGGKISIQRSPPRWVEPEFVERAAKLVTSLE